MGLLIGLLSNPKLYYNKRAMFEAEETSPLQKGYARSRRNVPIAKGLCSKQKKRPRCKRAMLEAEETSPLQMGYVRSRRNVPVAKETSPLLNLFNRISYCSHGIFCVEICTYAICVFLCKYCSTYYDFCPWSFFAKLFYGFCHCRYSGCHQCT